MRDGPQSKKIYEEEQARDEEEGSGTPESRRQVRGQKDEARCHEGQARDKGENGEASQNRGSCSAGPSRSGDAGRRALRNIKHFGQTESLAATQSAASVSIPLASSSSNLAREGLSRSRTPVSRLP